MDLIANLRVLVALFVLSLLGGCVSSVQAPLNELPQGTYHRGLVLQGADGTFRFRSCERDEWRDLELLDPNVEVQYQRITAQSPPVSVYLEGWIDRQGQLTRVQMIGGDIATCRQNLRGIWLRAGGLEPVWYADLDEAQLEVHHSTVFRSWRVRNPVQTASPGRWRWTAPEESTLDLALIVEQRPCVDLLGAWYALTARVQGIGAVLRGCARYGDLHRLLLAERYYSRDPNLLRQVGLILGQDERAELQLIDSGGESERYQGRWLVTRWPELVFVIEKQPNQPVDTLRFAWSEEGLRLVSQSRLLGTDLTLLPGGLTLLDGLRADALLP